MTILETVTIDTSNGPVSINKSDYDKDKHTLYVEPDPKKQSASWLKAQLTSKDVNFDGVSKKADLLKLYEMSHG